MNVWFTYVRLHHFDPKYDSFSWLFSNFYHSLCLCVLQAASVCSSTTDCLYFIFHHHFACVFSLWMCTNANKSFKQIMLRVLRCAHTLTHTRLVFANVQIQYDSNSARGFPRNIFKFKSMKFLSNTTKMVDQVWNVEVHFECLCSESSPLKNPSGCTRTAPSSGNWDAQDGPGALSNQIWCILQVHQRSTFRTNTNPIRIFGSGKPPSLTVIYFVENYSRKHTFWANPMINVLFDWESWAP